MNETPFHIFISLIGIDQQINTLNKETAVIDAQIAQLAKQRAQWDAETSALKIKVHDVQKNVDAYELEMKDLDAKEQAKKAQLEQLTSHKEYQGIKSEIDFLKKKQHDLEEALVGVWHDLEVVKKEYAQKEEQRTFKVADIEKEERVLAEKKRAIQQSLSQSLEQRTPVQAQVPAEWMQKYSAMRTRVADPVVPVVNKVCSACFYPASEQDMIALLHRRLVQCKDCFRLLYLPEAQEKKAS